VAPDVLRQLLRADPFRPFRVFTASGNSYLIPGPEWMLVTSLTSAVGVPGEAGDGDRLILLDNMSITETAPADPTTSGSKGS
jgi:hypothetical protein